eukprot:gb/GECG01010291.1/.p1 GENE.gb/GECG01010291.1/~~gb/GECG01010291.1/.p1  ORF type:complete len:186 (+),score=9.19 gb/GECG01010291.1/:1-558(+)
MYLHSRGVCHRDLSLENILVSQGCQRVIINDFGVADDISVTQKSNWNYGSVGKSRYSAPETLQRDRPYDGRFADVFSLGRILYLMLAGRYGVTSAISDPYQMERMVEHTWWRTPHVSNLAKDFLQRLLEGRPEDRLSTFENDQQLVILDHDWLKSYRHHIPREELRRLRLRTWQCWIQSPNVSSI